MKLKLGSTSGAYEQRILHSPPPKQLLGVLEKRADVLVGRHNHVDTVDSHKVLVLFLGVDGSVS